MSCNYFSLTLKPFPSAYKQALIVLICKQTNKQKIPWPYVFSSVTTKLLSKTIKKTQLLNFHCNLASLMTRTFFFFLVTPTAFRKKSKFLTRTYDILKNVASTYLSLLHPPLIPLIMLCTHSPFFCPLKSQVLPYLRVTICSCFCLKHLAS